MADVLVVLCGRRLGSMLHTDSDGHDRVIVPNRHLHHYLGTEARAAFVDRSGETRST